jgi:hypothetical protein
MVNKGKSFLALACVALSFGAIAGTLAPIRGSTGQAFMTSAAAVWWAGIVSVILAAAGSIPWLKEAVHHRRLALIERSEQLSEVRSKMLQAAEVYESKFRFWFASQREPVRVEMALRPEQGVFSLLIHHPSHDYPTDPRMKDAVERDLKAIMAEYPELEFRPAPAALWKYSRRGVNIVFSHVL